MEEPRVLRFAITPFVFFFWLGTSYLFSVYDDPLAALDGLKVDDLEKAAGVVIASAIPLGYMVSSVTVFVLRLLGCATGGHYEGTDLDAPIPSRLANSLRAARLAHAHDREGLSRWIERRWNAFMTSANGALATALALVSVPTLRECDEISGWWGTCVFLACVVLCLNAWSAWSASMAMLRHWHQHPRDGHTLPPSSQPL